MNLFMLNRKLINALSDKYIIFSAGYKGGIGKSVLSLGLAKEFNIPYITNDQGSAITGNIKFYENTYLTYDFIPDDFLKESRVVVVDLAGCFYFDKTIIKLIKKSNLVILPTGENPYIDHTGCLITAKNIYDINKNLLFITSGVESNELKEVMFAFNKTKNKYDNFDKLKLFGLSKCNKIIHDSMLKKRSYLRTYLALDETQKEDYKTFIKEWSKIIKEIKYRIEGI